MKNVMKYAVLLALSAAVVMACSAEVYAAHVGHDPAPVDAPLPVQLARGLVVTEAALPGEA
jgi:hypothetical protein